MKHTEVDSIPRIARLQFEAVAAMTDFGKGFQVDYELILPLERVDCRGTFNHKGRKSRPKSHRIVWLDADNLRHIPMGRTNVGSNRADYPFMGDGSIDLPFRDGAHFGWDNKHLNLPIYYTVRGKSYLLTKD